MRHLEDANKICFLSIFSLTPGGKVYWTDETNFKIEGADVNGTGRHTVYDDPQSQVFGIAYFQDYLYFTDWHKTFDIICYLSNGKQFVMALLSLCPQTSVT